MSAPDHSRICIVSGELNRLFRNGGVGTACTGLAQLLAADGHQVTVLYTGELPDRDRFDELAARYASEMRIEIVPLRRPPELARTRGLFAARSLAVYRQLTTERWDAVFFNDVGGEGFYSVVARRAGLDFHDTALCLVTHGPRTWVRELNLWPLANADELENVFMERETARLADHVISPSRYMLEWLDAAGWTLPERVRVTKCRLPRWPDAELGPPVARSPVRELAFFGRLERRKGVALFCDAVDELARTERDLRITFLGKFGDVRGEHAGGYVLRRARDWPFELQFLPRLDQPAALAYLRSNAEALAVIPSLVDNLPCVVQECLQLGIPFVSTNTGGIPELVAEADRGVCLCDPDPASLAAALRLHLTGEPPVGRPAEGPEDVDAAWRETLQQVLAARGGTTPGEPTDPVTVVVVSPNPEVAASTLESVASQTHEGIQLRATGGATDPGQARRDAIRDATAPWVLLLEDGAVLDPDAVRTLLRAARALGADGCTGLAREPGASETLGSDLPLGSDRATGYCRNVFGGSATLIRRDAVADAGLLDLESFGHDPWSSGCEATLAGLELRCVPRPLARAAPRAGSSHDPVRAAYERHDFRDCGLLHDLLIGHVRPADRQPHHTLLGEDTHGALLRQLSRTDPQSDDALRLMASHAARTGRAETALKLRDTLETPDTDRISVVLGKRDLHAAHLDPDCADVQADHDFDLVRVDGDGPALQVHPVVGQEIRCLLPLGNARGLAAIQTTVFLANPKAPPTEFSLAIRGHAPDGDPVAVTGWTLVEEGSAASEIRLEVPTLPRGMYDLVLATRLPGSRMSHAHARFRDIRLEFAESRMDDEGSRP